MNIALCFENLIPSRGGCETYIATLARRLLADKHAVHLYACRWDAAALPPDLQYHRLVIPPAPRFVRPWLFAAGCEQALREAGHLVSIGFDKTWGQDVLYPQGGLQVATAEHNLHKYPGHILRFLGRMGKWCDPAYWSYAALERRQYLGERRPLIVAISHMVQRHFQSYYDIEEADLRVLHCAIDQGRFPEQDRLRRRLEFRQRWGIAPDVTIGLFAAMNYRLKGLEPLLRSLRLVPHDRPFQLVIVGDPRTGHPERRARRLGVADRTRFLGYCADMRDSYFAADFLIHPTFYDPCSLVVLEALACGLPVITTRSNGASELLNPPREGLVVGDPHDHRRLAWCITQMLDPARRSACAQAARRTAAHWTFEHHYRELLQIFAEAAARKRAA